MSSDLSADWVASLLEDTLVPEPDRSSRSVSESHAMRIEPVEQRAQRLSTRPNGKNSGLRARLLLVDVVAIAGTWALLGTMTIPATSDGRLWGAAFAAAVITLIFMQFLGLYRSRLCVQGGQQISRILFAVAAGAATLEVLRGDADHSYRPVIVAAGCCALAMIAMRWMYSQWLRAQRANGRYLRGLVMIGANTDAAAIRTMLESEPELGYEVRGVIGKPSRRSDWARLPNRLSIEQLPEIAQETGANGVLLVANALSAAEVHQVIELAAANGLHVHVWPGFRGLGAHRVRRLPMSGETFLYVEPGRHSTWQFAAKRAVDIVGAAAGLMISLPVLLVAWAAIRFEDDGPALYRQVRVGSQQKPFVVYKLRTMVPDDRRDVDLAMINERTDGPLFKAAHDPRVTRVGAILRVLSIDEIPQLINVLTGQMSLVGPRPALPSEVAQFDPDLQRRHAVKPGVTGLWQLEARDNPSFHAYRRLDLFYVDNWSIGLDLFILLATVPMVVTRALALLQPHQAPQEARSESM